MTDLSRVGPVLGGAITYHVVANFLNCFCNLPTNRPSAPAQQRDRVTDRPTLSAAPAHPARDQTQITQPNVRLSRSRLAAVWLDRTSRPTDPLRGRPGAQSDYFQLRSPLRSSHLRQIWGMGTAERWQLKKSNCLK